MAENSLRRLRLGRRRRSADDLRRLLELADAVPLHDALRAEGDLELAVVALEMGIEPLGGAGKHGRAQHQQLAVGEMRQQRVDAVLNDLADGVEELVDRRADGDDDGARAGDLRRRGGKNQPVLLERPREQFLAAVFDERQSSRLQRLEHLPVGVVDIDPVPGLGKGEHQRNSDMTAAADDGQVGRVETRRFRCCRLATGKSHGGKLSEVRRARARGVIAQLCGLYKAGHRAADASGMVSTALCARGISARLRNANHVAVTHTPKLRVDHGAGHASLPAAARSRSLLPQVAGPAGPCFRPVLLQGNHTRTLCDVDHSSRGTGNGVTSLPR